VINMATLYGLGVGARFCVPGPTDPDSHQASCAKGTGLFQRVTRPERGVEHSAISRAEVENTKSYNFVSPQFMTQHITA